MAITKRVAILTGGGDVPGLNMCLKTLVYRLVDLGYEPIGVRMGWEGLIRYNPQDPTSYSDHFIELTKNMVRPIDRTPGSFLHSSRIDPRHLPARRVPDFLRDSKKETQDLTPHIQDVFKRLGYVGLIVVGDDDALMYAAHLSKSGLPIIGIPKTIHGNIPGTDYTLGFSTGLMRGVALIHELRALAGSREQILVVETFAAKSGYSTLLMSFLGGVDRVLIPEVPYDPDRLAYLAMQDKRQTPANYAVLLVTDGALPVPEKAAKYSRLMTDAGVAADVMKDKGQEAARGLVGSGEVVARILAHLTGEEVFHQPLTYLLRTGSPDGQDLLGASNFGITAARLLHEGRFGRMTAFTHDKMWTHVDLNLVTSGLRKVDIDTMYDVENYHAKLSLIWSVDND